MREAFSFSHFFNQKYWHKSDIIVWNFNETLTNDIVSFEQSGPGFQLVTEETEKFQNYLHKPPLFVLSGHSCIYLRHNSR